MSNPSSPNLQPMDIETDPLASETFTFNPKPQSIPSPGLSTSASLTNTGSFPPPIPPQNFPPPPSSMFNLLPQYPPTNITPYNSLMQLNNDEHLEITPSSTTSEIPEDLISISLKSLYPKLRLDQTSKEVPCILSVSGGSADLTLIEKNRSGLDLVFIVDISGSMGSGKIDLVKITIEFVISILKEFDRVCIITFSDSAFIVCPFTVMSESGKARAIGLVKTLGPTGGTNMEIGVRAGLHCLADRRVVNQNTSVFMLSDGVDNDVRTVNSRIQHTLAEYIPRIQGEFRFHTFGYGRDHDSRVMGALAENNNGNFYYIEVESSVTDAFGNCLGELVALIASGVTAEITTVACEVPFSLSKVYSSNGDTVFPMSNVFFDDRKDSVFVLNFPGVQEEVKVQRIAPVEAVVSYTLKSGEKASKKCVLVIEIAGEGEEIETRPEVMAEYYRVKGAEALKEVLMLADSNNLKEASRKAREAEEEMKSSGVASNPKIQALSKDLADAQIRVASKASWESGGRAQVSSVQNCHYNQKPSNNCVSYQTPMQNMYSLNANVYMANSIPQNPQGISHSLPTRPMNSGLQPGNLPQFPGINQGPRGIPGPINPPQMGMPFGSMPPGINTPMQGLPQGMNYPQSYQNIPPPGGIYPTMQPGYTPMNLNFPPSGNFPGNQGLGNNAGFGMFPGIPQTMNLPPQQVMPGMNPNSAPPQIIPGNLGPISMNRNMPPPGPPNP